MMDINTRKLNGLILEQLPQNIVNHIIQYFILIYQSSYDFAFDSKEKEQAVDFLFHERRANIESFLRLLPNRFPEIKVDCKINDSLTNYHVEVSINDIVLTQSFTRTKEEKVRSAKFRNSLTGFNDQLEMDLRDDKSNPLPDDNQKKYYVILNHGADSRTPQRPEFFQLVLPTKDSEVKIDILKLYDISDKVLQVEIEDIKSGEALLNPKLKRPSKTGESE